MNRKRESGLDIVRCFAIVSLPILHSYMWAGLYSLSPKECPEVLYVMLFALRWMVYCVVPLFMMLTGYLNESTKMDRFYLKKIVPILCSYIIISLLAYISITGHGKMGLTDMVIALLNYTANPYSWYVEMYIGLFLLAPFFNILWKALDKKQRSYLMIVLVLLSFFTQINSLFVYQENYVKIVPAWWGGIYPLSYFVIGKWMKEYRPHARKGRLFISVAALAVSEGIVTWLYSEENGNISALDSYCTITCALMAILLFVLLYDINVIGFKQKLAAHISNISFEIYLFTYITDIFIWNKFNQGNFHGNIKIAFIIMCIFSSFVTAVFFAEIYHTLKKIICRCLSNHSIYSGADR